MAIYPGSEIANASDEFGLLLDVSISQNISLSDLASYATAFLVKRA